MFQRGSRCARTHTHPHSMITGTQLLVQSWHVIPDQAVMHGTENKLYRHNPQVVTDGTNPHHVFTVRNTWPLLSITELDMDYLLRLHTNIEVYCRVYSTNWEPSGTKLLEELRWLFPPNYATPKQLPAKNSLSEFFTIIWKNHGGGRGEFETSVSNQHTPGIIITSDDCLTTKLPTRRWREFVIATPQNKRKR